MQIPSLVKSQNELIKKFLAWGIIPLVFLSWCFSTIGYRDYAYYILAFATSIVAGCIYIYCSGKREKTADARQLNKLSVMMVIVCSIFIPAYVMETQDMPRILGCLSSLFWIFISARNIYIYSKGKIVAGFIKSKFLTNRWLLCLCILIVVLSFDSNMFQLKWDGLLYYLAVDAANLSSLSSMALYGHLSLTPGFIYRLCAVLLGNVNKGMQLANIVVLLVGTVSFYKAIKVIVPNKKEYVYALATGCFAFSPYLLGMVNYYSTDWFCVCLMPVLIYSIVTRRYIEMIPVACLFCFTKEPAVIAYGMMCLGLVLTEAIDYKGKLLNKLEYIVSRIHYYYMLIPLILWVVAYKSLGEWSAGEGGFSFDTTYALHKIKTFACFNFNWIFSVLIVLGCIWVMRTGTFVKIRNWLTPLLFANVGLLAFNCLYVTVNHVRYIDSFISISIFIAVALVLLAVDDEHKVCSNIVLVILALTEIAACYISFDPISNILFSSERFGSSRVYSTGDIFLGDASVYNKQMLWMEHAINDALLDAIEEGDDIVFIIPDKSVYSFVGMSETIMMSEPIEKDILYWNTNTKKRVSYAENENCLAVNILLVNTAETITDDLFDNNSVSVLRIGDSIYNASGFENSSTMKYAYRGWNIYRDILKK